MTAEAYTVDTFLKAYPIGRTTLYAAWSEGRGPRRVTVGRRVLIPRESAELWIQKLLEAQGDGTSQEAQ